MYYSIELKNLEDFEDVHFPYSLSYFFEQLGGFGETNIVSQLEKILDIDLSIFQNTFNDDMEFDEEFEDFESEDNDDSWISIDLLINKLEEFGDKMNQSENYFSKVLFNPKDDSSIYRDYDFEQQNKYFEENPLSLYPLKNEIITDTELKKSVNELLHTLLNIKKSGESEVRLIYG